MSSIVVFFFLLCITLGEHGTAELTAATITKNEIFQNNKIYVSRIADVDENLIYNGRANKYYNHMNISSKVDTRGENIIPRIYESLYGIFCNWSNGTNNILLSSTAFAISQHDLISVGHSFIDPHTIVSGGVKYLYSLQDIYGCRHGYMTLFSDYPSIVKQELPNRCFKLTASIVGVGSDDISILNTSTRIPQYLNNQVFTIDTLNSRLKPAYSGGLACFGYKGNDDNFRTSDGYNDSNIVPNKLFGEHYTAFMTFGLIQDPLSYCDDVHVNITIRGKHCRDTFRNNNEFRAMMYHSMFSTHNSIQGMSGGPCVLLDKPTVVVAVQSRSHSIPDPVIPNKKFGFLSEVTSIAKSFKTVDTIKSIFNPPNTTTTTSTSTSTSTSTTTNTPTKETTFTTSYEYLETVVSNSKDGGVTAIIITMVFCFACLILSIFLHAWCVKVDKNKIH